MNELLGLVRKGRAEELVARLAPLSPAQRRELAGPLKQLAKAEGGIQQTSETSWRAPDERILRGLVVAGAGCLASATEVAAWMERHFVWPEHVAWVAQVLAARGPQWTGQVAQAYAAQLRVRDMFMLVHRWQIAAQLAVAAGVCPTHDGFVIGWLARQGYGPGSTVLERLRVDPFLDGLLPRIFEVDQAGAQLASTADPGGSGVTAFPAALAVLAAEGRLDRAWLLDACLGRFLRGGTDRTLKGFLHLHRALAPDQDEVAARARDYVRMLPDAPGTVAALGQAALRDLDRAARLDIDALTEASAAVLRRPEKALVRAQLTWLSTVVIRAPGPVLDVVAYAFAHPDLSIQDRALALVEAHIGACDEAVRSRLAAAAEGLGADLPARAAAILGTVPASVASVEPVAAVRPVRTRRKVAAIASPAELAAELAALEHDVQCRGLERVLDASVRLAATDRAGLQEATTSVLGRDDRAVGPVLLYHLLDVLQSVGEGGPRRSHTVLAGGWHDGTHALQMVIIDRLAEAARFIVARPVPFLLATPTWHTGHIDPDVLVDRVAAAEEGGWQPWPADLAQALLRLPRGIDTSTVRRASSLHSPAGRRLASVMATGVPDPVTRRVEVTRRRERYESVADQRRSNKVALATVAGQPPDPLVARVFAFDPPQLLAFGNEAIWPEVLPSHREVVAALVLDHLEYSLGGAHEVLPRLADADGPCGPAMVLALAYGLASEQPQARVAATDTLLALTPSDVDPAALGTEIGTLGGGGQITLSRVVDPLTQAASVAPAEVTRIVLHALAPLLRSPKPPVGTPDLLAMASRLVAPGTPVAPHIANEVATAAERSGATRVVAEARRLHRILSGAP